MNVPLRETAPKGALSIKQIVVAVGLSPHSEATARYAVEVAKAFGASIVLAHVHPLAEATEFTSEWGYREAERRRQAAQERLTSLTKAIQADYPECEGRFILGEPADEVARLAHELKADLIITASHHPGFLARLFNLDQAPQILHRASCPVLVYHEADR